MLRVRAADGQHAVQALVRQADHGGGADLVAFITAEEEFQLVAAQHAADGLAAREQAADALVRLGRADAAAHRQGVLAEQDEADVGHLELMAQAVFHRAHHFLQAGGIEQVEHQAAGLVEQPVVLPGHVHQLRQAMAHLDVALAQQLDLALHQGHGIARLVGDAHFGDQFFVVDEELRVEAQVGGHGLGVEVLRLVLFLVLVGHRRTCPSNTRTAGPVIITGCPGPAHSMQSRPPGRSSCTGESIQPWRIAATAAAQAPVPQARVSPAPRSQTRSLASLRSMSCRKPTFTRCGKRE
ncbi:hypothetical protein D3C72_1523440 [compost metagenome]